MAQVYKIDQKRYEFKNINSSSQTILLLSEQDHNKWIKVNTTDNSVEVQLPDGLSEGFRCVIENTGVFTVNYVNAAGTSIATQQDKFTEDQFRTVEAVYDNGVWRLQGYIGRQDLSSLYDVNVNAEGLPSDGDALVYDINSNIWRAGKNVPYIPADPFFLDHIITDEDHGQVLLFDTTAAPITVTLNLGLEDGLFVKIVNVGTGTLTIASAGTLKSAGTTLAQYQSMDVLHAASNIFYGVIAEGIGGTGSSNGGGYAPGNYFDTYIATSYAGLFPTTHETTSNSLAIGTLAKSFQDNQLVIGSNAAADAQYDIALGDQADCDGSSLSKIAIGRQATSIGIHSIALGAFSEAGSNNTIAIGSTAEAISPNSIQLGTGANNESSTLNFLSSRIAHSFGLNLRIEDAQNNTTNNQRFAATASDGGVSQHPTLATLALSSPNKILYVGTGTINNSGSPQKQWLPINVPPRTDYLKSRFENNVTLSSKGSIYFPPNFESRLWTDDPDGAVDSVNKEQWTSVQWITNEFQTGQVLDTIAQLYQANEPYFRKDEDSSSLSTAWRNRRVTRWSVTTNVAGLSNSTNGPFSIPATDFSALASLISKNDRVLFVGQSNDTENGVYRFDKFDGNFYVFNRPQDLQLGTSITTQPIIVWGDHSNKGLWTPSTASTVGSSFVVTQTNSNPQNFTNRALYFSIKAEGYYRMDMRLRLQAIDSITNPDARAVISLKYLDTNGVDTVRTKEVYRYNLFTKNSIGANILRDIRLNETLNMNKGTYFFTLAFYDTPDIVLFSNVTNDEYGESFYEIIPQQLFEAPF